jgi:hypothetical protein
MQTRVIAKPVETEGVLDLYLIRPLGAALAEWLRATPITPNGVSWLSVFAAIAAAIAYSRPTLAGATLGSLFLLLNSGLDAADGQLARITGRTSELGETLDGFCDSLSFGAIYVAAALALVDGGFSPVPAFALALVAGASHSLQSALVDFERQVFIYIVRGTGRIERENPERLRGELARARRDGEGGLQILLRWLRLRYCMNQQACLATSIALARATARLTDSRQRERVASRYRDTMRGMLRAWTLMAPNAHKVAIAVCAFVPVLVPDMPGARYGLGLVLAVNLGLNLVLAALVLAQRRIDRRFMREIAAASAAPHQG